MRRVAWQARDHRTLGERGKRARGFLRTGLTDERRRSRRRPSIHLLTVLFMIPMLVNLDFSLEAVPCGAAMPN